MIIDETTSTDKKKVGTFATETVTDCEPLLC